MWYKKNRESFSERANFIILKGQRITVMKLNYLLNNIKLITYDITGKKSTVFID